MAIRLNGTNNYINFGWSRLLYFGSNNFTIGFKMNFTSTAGVQEFVTFSNSAGSNNIRFFKNTPANNNTIRFFTVQSSVTQCDYVMTNPFVVAAGSDYTIIVCRTLSSMAFYINGSNVTLTESLAFSSNNAAFPDETWGIGTRPVNTGSLMLTGDVSEVFILNSMALTQEQVTHLTRSNLKNMPLMIGGSNLVLYFPLNEFVDGTVASGSNSIMDRSKGGHFGLPLNSPLGVAENRMSYQ